MVARKGLAARLKSVPDFPYDRLKAPFGYRTRWWLSKPPLTMKKMRDVVFADEDFISFEKVLSRPLDDGARLALEMVCGEFVFAVLFRDEVRPEKRYQQALSKELGAVHKSLISTLRLLDAATDDGGSVTPGIKVHGRQWMLAEWGEPVTAMRNMERQLSETISELSQAPKKGRDGYYELKYLLHNLYLIAEFSGASLSINSHSDLLGEVFRSKFKPTRLVQFCSKVLEKTVERAPKALAGYSRSAAEKAAAMRRLQKLKKEPHKLVPDLEQIRADWVEK
jgi:hypothetical protein